MGTILSIICLTVFVYIICVAVGNKLVGQLALLAGTSTVIYVLYKLVKPVLEKANIFIDKIDKFLN